MSSDFVISAALFPCPPSESGGSSRDDDSTGQRQAGQACHDCVPLRNRALVIPGVGKDWLSPLTIIEPMFRQTGNGLLKGPGNLAN